MADAHRTEAAANGTAGSGAASGVRTKKRGWFRRNAVTLILLAIMLVGLGLLLYPSVSNWWNQMHQSRAVMNYAEAVSQMDSEQYQQMLQAAEDYNAKLSQTGQKWQMSQADQDEYNSLLNVDGNGVMGYIRIPKIDVELPIYHGTDDAVLQTSIGHLAGTSLPVGGAGSHCVLSGHRGLPSARLFSDLDRMVEGDTFTLTVLNETLTYQVDQIRVVEPNDLSDLQIEPGQDYCTLVTCTPYGINTQRLLVRGHRIPNANGDAQVIAEAIQIRPAYIAFFVTIPVLILLVAYVFWRTGVNRREEARQAAYLASMGLHRPTVDIDNEHAQSLISAIRDYLKRR